jgi:hypothetical protein
MLRTLEYFPRTMGSTIVKSREMRPAREAADILVEARATAATLIEDARTRAERSVEAGFRRGVSAGVEATMAPLLALISQLQQLQSQLAARAHDQVRQSVQAMLARGEVLERLIEVILATFDVESSSNVHITLPESAAHYEANILEHCRALQIQASVHVSSDGVFAIDWAGHRWDAQGLVPATDSHFELHQIGISPARAVKECADALTAAARHLRSSVSENSRARGSQ